MKLGLVTILAATLPIMAGAEETGFMESPAVHVRFMQGDHPLELAPDVIGLLGGQISRIEIAPGPLTIDLPRQSCAEDQQGTMIRVYDGVLLPDVADQIAGRREQPDDKAAMEAIFPTGYAMAADVGKVSTLYTDQPELATMDQGFNFFFDARFTARSEARDLITIDTIGTQKTNLLKGFTAFVLVIGHSACDATEAALPVDVIEVSFSETSL